MQLLKAAFFATLLASLGACNNSINTANDVVTENLIDTSSINAAYDKGTLVSEIDLVKANTAFAFDLLKATSKTGENLVASPYSISLALGMTYAGAQTETELEMRQTLHFPDNNTQALHYAFKELNNKIKTNCEGAIQLNNANKVWTLENFVIKEGFQALNQGLYNSEIGKFANASDAVQKVNAWVAQQTNNKIQDILQKGDFDETTKMALVNAIYFNGNWETPFDKKATFEDSFFVSANEKVPATFMNAKVDCQIADYEQYQVLELFYKNRKASILILLPKENFTLDTILPTLTADVYLSWMNQLSEGSYMIRFPKFKIAPPTLKLKDIFVNQLNMKTPFGVGQSPPNFSKMSDEEIQIGDILHKAFIDVNETGTEAAAATVVEITKESASFPLIINRPFLYFIKDSATNSILFMGQICNPSVGN